MTSGIYLIDKAKGLSSAAEIARLKKKLKLSKAGHAGTLDPMATGLLVCLSNSATRLASYAEKGQKVYSGTIRFGLTTDTDDIEGKVISESGNVPSLDHVRQAVVSFTGEISQLPPAVSAVKIAGERAYKIARRGEMPAVRPRIVNVEKFEISSISGNDVCFRVTCGSGTYIRSLARDLGAYFACGACLSSLRREHSAPFDVSSAKSTQDISDQDRISWVNLFPYLNRVCFDSVDSKKLVSGDLKSIRPRLGRIISEQAKNPGDAVIYYDGALDAPRGILKNVSGNWEIAVNMH